MNTKTKTNLTTTNEFASESCLQGFVDVSYAKLTETFGEPNAGGDGDKVDAEWVLKGPDGFVTIYNYKDGKNYCGSNGLDVENITDWHIGGKDSKAVQAIADVFGVENVRWGW